MPVDNRADPDQLNEELDSLDLDEAQDDTAEETESDVIEEIEEDLDADIETEPEEGEEPQKPTTPKEKPQEPDYKEKFKASTQEAQVLAAKNKKLTETIDQAAQINDIDETELRTEYSDWDELSDTQKKIAKDTLINKKRFDMINSTVADGKKIDDWGEKVDTFLLDDTQTKDFPGINGREQEFKAFCMKPSRRGVDMEDLASAFLHQSPLASTRKKGSLLLSGSNSGEHNTKPAKMSAEEAGSLRRRSPTAYMKAVREGKISDEL